MTRKNIDPWDYGEQYGIRQAVLIEAQQRVLYCSGQASVDANGAPQHPGDMAAQLHRALDNVEAVLKMAGMGLDALVRLNIYTTDLDALMKAHSVLAGRLRAAGAEAPGTLLEVKRLAAPTLLVELEATAAN